MAPAGAHDAVACGGDSRGGVQRLRWSGGGGAVAAALVQRWTATAFTRLRGGGRRSEEGVAGPAVDCSGIGESGASEAAGIPRAAEEEGGGGGWSGSSGESGGASEAAGFAWMR